MIGNVTVDAGGQAQSLRLTTRAMMRVEERFDQGIVEFVQALEGSPRIGQLVALLAACMNDGAGATDDEAGALMDEIGFDRAGELLMQAVSAAFPEAETDGGGDGVGGPAKNPKRAGRKG